MDEHTTAGLERAHNRNLKIINALIGKLGGSVVFTPEEHAAMMKDQEMKMWFQSSLTESGGVAYTI